MSMVPVAVRLRETVCGADAASRQAAEAAAGCGRARGLRRQLWDAIHAAVRES